jgi:hypothetical protein
MTQRWDRHSEEVFPGQDDPGEGEDDSGEGEDDSGKDN